MKYFILIRNAEGESRLIPIADLTEIAVAPGDDIVVMDENGNPVDVRLRPDGNHLIVDFKNGESVVLKDFYEIEEGGRPITISLNPKEPVEANYEFNSQTGNLPNAKSFTLMRYSNTEYIDFVEQLDELNLGSFSWTLNAPGFGGGDGGAGINRNVPPEAIDDSGETDQNSSIIIDVLSNDFDPNPNDTLIISGVDQPEKGSVSINASNQLVFDPGSDFAYLGAGESEVVTFTYSIFDGNGGSDTATVTIIVHGVDDATVTNPDSATTNEDTPVTIDVLANDSDVDTSDNPLSIASVTQPTLGLVTNNGSDVTFDPNDDFENLAVGETATVTFTYTTSTGATENVTVTILGVNDPPTAVDDAETTDQNTAIIIDAISNDTDPDESDILFITGVDQPAKGSASINASNQIVFDPGNDFDDLGAGESETITFNYSISDGNGGTDIGTITVTVNGIDDPTVTNPDSATTNEDTPVTIDVLANDSDVDTSDNPLSIASVTQPTLGLVTNNGSDVTFDPNGDFENLAVGETATVTFTYTTSTGATENVTVTILGVNDAPTAVDDAESTDQNSVVNIDLVSNDTDPDGDTLTVINLNGTVVAPNSVVALPSGASIMLLADGTVNYNPNGQFVSLGFGESATDAFTYVVSDGNGGTSTATAVVTIHGIDDPTITNPDTGLTDEDTPVTIAVLANDSDPDTSDNPLSIASVTQPGLGLVTNNGSDVIFDPNGDFENLAAGETATVTFTYTTNTGATENVTVTIQGVNDAPILSSTVTSGTVYEAGLPSGTGIGSTDTTVTGIFTAVDPDGNALLVRVNGVDLGFLDGNPDTIVGTATGDDGNGVLTIYGDGSWSYQLLSEATHDGDDTTFNENEREEFSVTVFDGTVESAPVNLTINIVDDIVVIGTPSSGSLLNATNSTYTGSLGSAGADANFSSLTGAISGWDGTTTTFAATSLTSQGQTVYYFVDPSDESVLIAYTDSSATPTAYDPMNPSQSAVFILDVEASNDSYQLTMLQPIDIWESTAADFSVLSASGPKDFYLFTDGPSLLTPGDPVPPGESVVFSVYSTIAGGKVNSNSNYLGINNNLVDPGESVTVDLVQQGRTVSIAYAFNGGGTNTQIAWTAYATDDVTVLATGVHNAEGINTGSFTISHNWLKLGKVELAPLNSGTKSFRIATIVVGGFDSETPLALGFPVTVIDDDGDSASAVILVDFYNPSGPPIVVAMPDSETTDQNTAVLIDALGNDIDSDPSDPLTITSITQPSSGSAWINGSNEIVFDPEDDFAYLNDGESATVTFEYTVSDGVGGSDTATITVTVTGLDDPTVTNPDAATTDEDSPVTIAVLANDSDPDASDNPLAITSVTQPLKGLVTNNGTDLTFDPAGAFEDLSVGATEIVTFTYTTSTGATENVTVTVTGVNDAPVVNDDFVVSTTDIIPVTIDVLANDTDIDGTIDPGTLDLDPFTPGIQTSFTVTGEGTWTTDGTGMVTFTPDPGITDQPTPITYAVSDNDGGTSQGTVTLKYSAADVWFGNDESGSVDAADFLQSRNLISGAANQMSFATGELAFNAAVFSWGNSTSQQMAVALTADKAAFVNDSANYTRNYSGGTDIGAAIVFGTQQILASVAAKQLANDPRAGVPQVMVILTDATSSQILNDSSLLSDAQAAKDAGIILVFVAIQEAQQDPNAVARLQDASSKDQNGDPFVITAANYADIGPSEIADLLNAIREAAAAGLLPPIVIDLDGDGAEFTTIDNGILFDVDGDGVMEQVAWAGRDDAVLVYDANGNNNVDGVHEISFARYSSNPNATDLEGLRFFDTNGDLILDANDAEFESFKLWQDKNGNGIVDEGEMMTLAEAGIVSLELTSDGKTYYTAGGDVKVNGTAFVHYEDGSTGVMADAEFGYRNLIEENDSIVVVTQEGDTLDLGSDPLADALANEPAGPDLLESVSGPVETGEDTFSGSAPLITGLEDDLAAAGANMG